MKVRRYELDEWIKELKNREITEFEFGDLPDDLKDRRGIQKARGLGMLKSIKTTKGRHTWKIVPSNMWRKDKQNCEQSCQQE